jgi:hypothetical protein
VFSDREEEEERKVLLSPMEIRGRGIFVILEFRINCLEENSDDSNGNRGD